MIRLLSRLNEPSPQLFTFVLLLGVGLAFVLPKLSRYHGDEKFYTDAAIGMVQSGDYWTPRYPDGTARLVKPVLTYWVTAASYRVFGISYFSSRLPFLAAACLLLLGTYALARTLFGRSDWALLAALILGSNFQLLALATRSTPDALLCLFALLSSLGFTRILFQADRSFIASLLAYGGAGLAVQTKGLLGLCPVALAWLFCALFRRERMALRGLLDWRALLIGAALALFWYAVMFQRHGRLVSTEFFHDQVTAKVAFNPLIGFASLVGYFFAAFRHFLPWTLLVLVGGLMNPAGLAGFWRSHRLECRYLLGWFLLLAAVFSFGNMVRTRYLAASYPMLAVLLAGVLGDRLSAPAFEGFIVRTLRWLAGGVGLLAVLLGAAGVRIAPHTLAGSVIMLGIAAGLGAVARRRIQSAYGWAFAVVPVAGFLCVELLWRPLFTGSPAPALTAAVLDLTPPVRRAYAWNPTTSYPSQMRVLSGGQLDVRALETQPGQPPPSGLTPIILTAAQRQNWLGTNYTFRPAAFVRPKWEAGDFRAVLLGSRPNEVIAHKREPFYLALYQGPQDISNRLARPPGSP